VADIDFVPYHTNNSRPSRQASGQRWVYFTSRNCRSPITGGTTWGDCFDEGEV